MTDTDDAVIVVEDRGQRLAFGFADLMRYAGPYSPAGVAVAFQAMRRAFALLAPGTPVPRRVVLVRTAFRGPGARDGFEAVTRAVTEGRYLVDRDLARPDLGPLREDFVFDLSLGDGGVQLVLRDGFVTAEFVELARTPQRSPAEERRLDELKAAVADSLLSADPADLFDVTATE